MLLGNRLSLSDQNPPFSIHTSWHPGTPLKTDFDLKIIIGIGINTITSPKNKKFKSISLLECSNRNFKNEEILMKIKLAYEKTFSNFNKNQYLK